MPKSDLLDHEKNLDELERLALAWQAHTLLGRATRVNVVHFLETTVSSLLPHFAVKPRSPDELPHNRALTSYNPTQIEVRESIYLAAARGHPAASFELWHEFAHVALHDASPKSLLDGTQERILLQNAKGMSVEEQADEFRLFLTIPRRMAEAIGNLSEVMYACNVPYAAAEKAMIRYGINQKRKLHPYEIQHLMTREEEPY